MRTNNNEFYEAEIEAAQDYIEASRRYTFGLCELSLPEAVQCANYYKWSSLIDHSGTGMCAKHVKEAEPSNSIFQIYKEMFVSAVVAGWSGRDDWGEKEIRDFFDRSDGCFINEECACYPWLRDMAIAGFKKAVEVYKAMDDAASAKLNEAGFDICVDSYESGNNPEYIFAL